MHTGNNEAFRKAALRTVGAILFFILVYLLLVCLAIGLIYLGISGHWYIPLSKQDEDMHYLFPILVIPGVFALWFLLSFLFEKWKQDDSHFIQIEADQHPALFELIREVVNKVGAPMPGKVYLYGGCNAMVFYNSQFWSLLFPVKKNLLIGLGLVNIFRVDELKAVLGHEFGHFSQRSMKLGSYAYVTNRILYGWLHEETRYKRTMQRLRRMHVVLETLVIMSGYMIMGIEWVLRRAYLLVQRSYSDLSKQMEFHADAMAARCAGWQASVSALYKSHIADFALDTALHHVNRWINDDIQLENIYPVHTRLINRLARKERIPLYEKPYLSGVDFGERSPSSRIVLDDQWASHPETGEREEQLAKLAIEHAPAAETAWSVFNNPAALQLESTRTLYKQVKFTGSPVIIDELAFAERYEQETQNEKLPDAYNGYYDHRDVNTAEPEEEVADNPAGFSPATVFTRENARRPVLLGVLQYDLDILENIIMGHIKLISFDFAGVKCRKPDAYRYTDQLRKEIEEQENLLKAADKAIYAYLSRKATEKGETELWKQQQYAYQHIRDQRDNCMQKVYDMLGIMSGLNSGLTSNPRHNALRIIAISDQEKELKPVVREILDEETDETILYKKDREALEKFMSARETYQFGETLNYSALQHLASALHRVEDLVKRRAWRAKKKLLEYQAKLGDLHLLPPGDGV